MILAITLFTIFANIYLGTAVVSRNPKSATHRLFALYATLVGLWAVTNYLSIQEAGFGITLLRIRMVLVTAAIMFPLLYLLADTFPLDRMRLSKIKQTAVIVFALATAGLSLTPLVFKTIESHNKVVVPVPGPGILLYALNVLGFPILAFLILRRKYRESTGRSRAQIGLFMWGVGITFALAEITNFILVNVFQFTNLVVLGPFFTLILVGFISYAVIKYRFLDIPWIVVRSISYGILVILIIAFYVSAIALALRYTVLPPSITGRNFIAILLFGLVLATASEPIRRAILKILGKKLFRGIYTSEELLFQLARAMATEIDFDALAPKILETIMGTMNITKAAILLVEHHRIIDIKQKGFENFLESKLKALEDILNRDASREAIVFEETTDETLKELLRNFDIEVIIPVKVGSEKVAMLIFGPKAAGDIYNKRDLAVLGIFAQEVGVSLENARNYKNLQLLDKVQSEFISVVSHQFRTPLTEARWRLETLLGEEYVRRLKEQIKNPLTDIYLSTLWLVESLNKLFLAFDLEVKRVTIQRVEIDMNLFIPEKIFRSLHDLASIKKVTLEMIEATDSIDAIGLDASKTEDALRILVENAINYSEPGSRVAISVSERIAQDQRKYLQLTVKDDGIGIAEKDKPHLFSKFYRGDHARRLVPNGLGLGLFITRTIVEMHEGKVWFESQEGKGATFFVEFPYINAEK